MVFAIPAENGGALSNLMELYRLACDDTHNQWVFAVGVANIETRNNIEVINYPFAKKSWLNRLFFDFFIYGRLIKTHNPDIVYNQQSFIKRQYNKAINFFYATNVLFFSEIKVSPLKNFSLWLRSFILKPFEVYSIKNADKIIVESEWFRDLLCDRYNLSSEQFVVKEIHTLVKKKAEYHQSKPCCFFYPASAFIYKNHQIILDAALLLKKDNLDFSIVFTLNGTENKYISSVKSFSDSYSLPVKWCGRLNTQELERYYESSVLVFPSKLESAGLPLYEAMEMDTPILCSDMRYAKSATNNYNKVHYFSPDNSLELYNYMKRFCVEN